MVAQDRYLEAYSEIANIGTGNAATALAGFLHSQVTLDPPVAYQVDLPTACELLISGRSPNTAVVLLACSGDLDGVITLFIEDPAPYLAALGAPLELEAAAIGEIGNIFAARFLEAIGSMFGLQGHYEPPATASGSRAAIMETVLAMASDTEPYTLVRCWLRLNDGRAPAELVYFPGPSSLRHVESLV
jgi:chemotaxis protein CheC